MIKFYEDGIMTKRLRVKKCGDCVEISDPVGCFNVWSDCAEAVLMLAAGTGLAPMLRITAVRLKNNKRTTILLFNKQMSDIMSEEYFSRCMVSLENPLLKLIHCLSEPDLKWYGEKVLFIFFKDDNITQCINRIDSTVEKRNRILCGVSLLLGTL
ncbi:unnamed protein product [Gongylonema pulchrum]|uniref:Oxidoreductase FAD/NAD(P)-binding domain-containing protein n=1 Tax=Gongylonema pulchrum TaxID=637853 RepID=A0A3P7MFM1_9BILA|nr:unnamed protein product [Gongylonema pulchrum]